MRLLEMAEKGGEEAGILDYSRVLSWDPSAPQRLAWVRGGNGTTLVSVEQLRAATGFESWSPSEEDIKALKEAQVDFEEHLTKDEIGPNHRPMPRKATYKPHLNLDQQ
jgi:hypothetical protein